MWTITLSIDIQQKQKTHPEHTPTHKLSLFTLSIFVSMHTIVTSMCYFCVIKNWCENEKGTLKLKEERQSGLRKENGKKAIVDLMPNLTGTGFLLSPKSLQTQQGDLHI